ncbi:cytoplasmic protein [Bacillus sp. FJAT-27225]|uniref:class I SAM-dependent methyltransferase n=1 Tax=Bacillus sp. FJAT-27225 TaxID=1743144 RepID=UPI00080C2626|nr:SAM-dependent methyltransferase [Bacillus sp. FJAT-27225]OCA91102.1 cytoplasmic protein [Bacillus sp. FJAT-27225]
MLSQLEQKINNAPGRLITYAEFIEMALYFPENGYYMREGEKIGRSGDFITTSNISDIYGRTLAKWYLHLATRYKLAPEVCEIGGGNGRFAKAFLDEWRLHSDTDLQYAIVETSPYHRKLQAELLSGFPGFSQHETLAGIRIQNGLIFSNELFDALPVHVVEKQRGQLFEVKIGLKEGRFYEQPVPLTESNIASYLERSGLSLAEGQRIEVPLAMESMVRDISESLEKGLVVTVDYGYTNEEWQSPARRRGSLRGYKAHRMYDDVLQDPGSMDITTHIHLDGLIEAGQRHGLGLASLMRQDEFLIAAGILKELEEHYDPDPFSERSRRNRAIRSLVLPSGMSASFHVIIQQKATEIGTAGLFE